MANFFEFSAVPLGQKDPIGLDRYKGQVLLVVNTAAHCGYTPQYKPLGELARRYAARGFHVLGFVSDEFGHQAGSVDELQACSLKFRAEFPQFAEMHVKKGPQQDPLFQFLTSQKELPGDVKWNFNKWLVGKHGELLARWGSDEAPDSPRITAAIESALASQSS